jgi:hypothetical protein
MLVSSEGINIDRERLASAQRTEEVGSAGFVMVGFKITSIFFATLKMKLSEAYPPVQYDDGDRFLPERFLCFLSKILKNSFKTFY